QCIDDELTILDVRKFKAIHRRKFNYEVNEIAWIMTGDVLGNILKCCCPKPCVGIVEILAYPSLQPLDTVMAHTAGCYCIAIDPMGSTLEATSSYFPGATSSATCSFMPPAITEDKVLVNNRGTSLLCGRYFAVGSADSLVSLWDIEEMLCVRTFIKLEWPVKTISFNYRGDYIASASEDLFIDISNVQTGRSVHQIPCRAAMNSPEWNPKYNLLAYAGDDKDKYQADEDQNLPLSFSIPECFGIKRSEQNGLVEPMKDEEETTKSRDFSLDEVHSGLRKCNSTAKDVFFSLPEFEKHEIAWTFRDFH
ncbi:hypothetical protein RJ641_032175, partial [Dillenia turbinata]